MRAEKNHNFNKLERECDGCGSIFKVQPYKVNTQKYVFCTNDCYKKNIGKYFSGENNHNYNHLLTKEERIIGQELPRVCKRGWRSEVFRGDEFTCQFCGDSSGGNLEAHHIDGYSWCEDKRLDVGNGITLCKQCHKEFHNKYRYVGTRKNNLILGFTAKTCKRLFLFFRKESVKWEWSAPYARNLS